MQIRLTVTLAVSLLVLGASYAFADGILNDSSVTRARGGVGNYLFWSLKDQVTSDENELISEGEFQYENGPNYGGDELSIRQSAAIAPTQMVLFDRASARVYPPAIIRLDEIANTLKSDPGLRAQITGYASAEGPGVDNQTLSRERAKAVVAKLKSRGVSGRQLSWIGRGERDPITQNDTPEGRSQNRRVEIHFE